VTGFELFLFSTIATQCKPRIFILCVKMLSVWKATQGRWWLVLSCFYSLQLPRSVNQESLYCVWRCCQCERQLKFGGDLAWVVFIPYNCHAV